MKQKSRSKKKVSKLKVKRVKPELHSYIFHAQVGDEQIKKKLLVWDKEIAIGREDFIDTMRYFANTAMEERTSFAMEISMIYRE